MRSSHLEYGHVIGGESLQGGFALPWVVLGLPAVVVLQADLLPDALPALYGARLLQDEQVDVH